MQFQGDKQTSNNFCLVDSWDFWLLFSFIFLEYFYFFIDFGSGLIFLKRERKNDVELERDREVSGRFGSRGT